MKVGAKERAPSWRNEFSHISGKKRKRDESVLLFVSFFSWLLFCCLCCFAFLFLRFSLSFSRKNIPNESGTRHHVKPYNKLVFHILYMFHKTLFISLYISVLLVMGKCNSLGKSWMLKALPEINESNDLKFPHPREVWESIAHRSIPMLFRGRKEARNVIPFVIRIIVVIIPRGEFLWEACTHTAASAWVWLTLKKVQWKRVNIA